MVHRPTSPGAGTVAVHDLVGTIAHAGFESGDRFVVGWWSASPIGPLHDVMWASPEGERVLLVDRPAAGAFISAVYGFDRVEVVEIDGTVTDRELRVRAGRVTLDLSAGGGWRLPFPRLRTPAVTRWVEGPVAQRLLGVRTYGVSPTGVREWYRADTHRRVVAGAATVDGRPLGRLRPFERPAGFGFSEPPRQPAMVRVRPRLHDPSGELDRVISRG